LKSIEESVFNAYWTTVLNSRLDQLILLFGFALIVLHGYGLTMRFQGTKRGFVQGIDRYRSFLLLLTEILPVLGLLGTVLGLMNTFQSFQMASGEGSSDLSAMIQAFSPAMSTTISGLLMIMPNLLLNALLWLASPVSETQDGSR